MSDPTRADLEAREQAKVEEITGLSQHETALEKALEQNRSSQARALGALTEIRSLLGKDPLGNQIEPLEPEPGKADAGGDVPDEEPGDA